MEGPNNIQVPEWYETRNHIYDAYMEKLRYGSNLHSALFVKLLGPCDKCTGELCGPRDGSKGLWEL